MPLPYAAMCATGYADCAPGPVLLGTTFDMSRTSSNTAPHLYYRSVQPPDNTLRLLKVQHP